MKLKKRSQVGQISDMDMRLLRVFKAVVDCGGMAAAELELNIGISTISRHVKDLEIRLGLALCRRGRGGFSLTQEGEQIYAQTLSLLAATDAFRTGVDEIHQHMGGQLHIALFDKTASNPASNINQAIALFCQLAPDVNLQLHVAPINAIETGIMNGRFQIGVIPGHRKSDSLEYENLFDETMYLYAGHQHSLFNQENLYPKDWESLRAFHFAGLGYHSPNMEISQQVRLSRKATAFDQEGVATLILSGQFLGFLPDHYAHAFIEKGLMQAINPAVFQYRCEFLSIVRRSPQASRTTQLFAKCLKDLHNLTS